MFSNIFNYIFYRLYKHFIKAPGGGRDVACFAAALYCSLLFFGMTSFILIPIDILYGQYLKTSTYIYIIILAIIFYCKFRIYDKENERVLLFQKYEKCVLNRYVPDWTIPIVFGVLFIMIIRNSPFRYIICAQT